MDIEAWLKGLGLEVYAGAFAENDVDAETLARLTAGDLKDIGVASVGHRRKLLDAIAALGDGTGAGRSEQSQPAAAPLAGEQRQVTVLFADLAGFTKLSAELGAEDTHALLNRYFEVVDGIVAGYGGHVDKHMGDNVMAVFGAPVAHSDDPKRAVRAALDIHKAMAAQQPTLITVEDIHWAGPLILAHLARLASAVADCPAILVMTSRLEGDPLDQAWRTSLRGAPLTTIDLQALRAAEAEELAAGFADAVGEFLQECIARAEGNPLFLEQLLRNAEEGAFTEVPGSIQSLVLARMDRLEPLDKRALQAASVVGQRFTPDVLRHLIEDPAYRCDELIEHRLIRPEAGGYLFAHALIREGAYSSLLHARKRELHGRAAGWFADHDLGLRAEHLDRAEDARAPSAYLEAAEAQVRIYHFDQALKLTERGLVLARAGSDKFALTCLKGRILHDLGAIPESVETYRTALDLAADDAERSRAWYGLAAGMRLTDEFDRALEALDQAETGAAKHDLILALSQIHHLRGNLYFPMGNMEGCLEQHGRALECARQAASPEDEARALGGWADAMYARGRMRASHDYFQECIGLCREYGFGRIEVANLSMLGLTRYYLGDQRGAWQDIQAAAEAAARVGHFRAELVACLSALYQAMEISDNTLHEQMLERSMELIDRLGAKRFEADCLNFRARNLTAQGRGTRDAAILGELRRLREDGERMGLLTSLRALDEALGAT